MGSLCIPGFQVVHDRGSCCLFSTPTCSCRCFFNRALSSSWVDVSWARKSRTTSSIDSSWFCFPVGSTQAEHDQFRGKSQWSAVPCIYHQSHTLVWDSFYHLPCTLTLGKQLNLSDPHFSQWKMDIIIVPNSEGCCEARTWPCKVPSIVSVVMLNQCELSLSFNRTALTELTQSNGSAELPEKQLQNSQ